MIAFDAPVETTEYTLILVPDPTFWRPSGVPESTLGCLDDQAALFDIHCQVVLRGWMESEGEESVPQVWAFPAYGGAEDPIRFRKVWDGTGEPKGFSGRVSFRVTPEGKIESVDGPVPVLYYDGDADGVPEGEVTGLVDRLFWPCIVADQAIERPPESSAK